MCPGTFWSKATLNLPHPPPSSSSGLRSLLFWIPLWNVLPLLSGKPWCYCCHSPHIYFYSRCKCHHRLEDIGLWVLLLPLSWMILGWSVILLKPLTDVAKKMECRFMQLSEDAKVCEKNFKKQEEGTLPRGWSEKRGHNLQLHNGQDKNTQETPYLAS